MHIYVMYIRELVYSRETPRNKAIPIDYRMKSDTSKRDNAIKLLCLRGKIGCKQLYSCRSSYRGKGVPDVRTSLPNYTYCISSFNMSSDTFSPSKTFIKKLLQSLNNQLYMMV